MKSSTTLDLPLIEQGPDDEENTRCEANIVKAIEIVRMIGAAIALFFGFGSNHKYRLSAALFVFFMAGLTGLESLFFGKISSRAKKWDRSPYQTQSACNNLASAVAMIILLSIGANDAAIATLMMSVTLFILLSGINHFVTVIIDKMNGKDVATIHFARFFLAIAVSVAVGFILEYWMPFTSK
jgi:F0F1-type ATP synthase membrane subunit a